MSAMNELLKDASDQLREWAADNPDETEPHDAIHEIADGLVPVYPGDLMQLAADNIDLATAEPDLGPAFDGSPTPVNIVAANVYEALQEECWEEWRRIEAEREGEPSD